MGAARSRELPGKLLTAYCKRLLIPGYAISTWRAITGMRSGRNSWGFFEIATGGGDDYEEVWHSAAAPVFGAGVCGPRGAPGFAVVSIRAKGGAGADSGIGEGRRVQRGRRAEQPGNEFARAGHRSH